MPTNEDTKPLIQSDADVPRVYREMLEAAVRGDRATVKRNATAIGAHFVATGPKGPSR